MSEPKESPCFITTDMELITVLLEIGHKLIDIEKKPMKQGRPSASRILFKFETGPGMVKKWTTSSPVPVVEERSLRDTIVMYNNDEVLVPARRLLNRLRNVKSLISNANVTGNLTQGIFNED